MRVPEQTIAEVVQQASKRMSEAQYISGEVDRLMVLQPQIGQYVIAHQTELTVEGIVTVLFHAALIHESVARATGRHPAPVSFQALDEAASAAPTVEALTGQEPELASFIASNVTLDQGAQASAVAQRILAHIAAALVR